MKAGTHGIHIRTLPALEWRLEVIDYRAINKVCSLSNPPNAFILLAQATSQPTLLGGQRPAKRTV